MKVIVHAVLCVFLRVRMFKRGKGGWKEGRRKKERLCSILHFVLSSAFSGLQSLLQTKHSDYSCWSAALGHLHTTTDHTADVLPGWNSNSVLYGKEPDRTRRRRKKKKKKRKDSALCYLGTHLNKLCFSQWYSKLWWKKMYFYCYNKFNCWGTNYCQKNRLFPK